MSTNHSYPLTIVGGGASGLTAAIAAAQAGVKVLLLEKNARVGKKILVTGNGRCNYTNQQVGAEDYYGGNPAFVNGAFHLFSPETTVEWFRILGIEPKLEDEGKIFPRSEQAGSVLDVLRYECMRLGVEIHCEAEVQSVSRSKKGFIIRSANGINYQSQALILATGGKAMPGSGSDGHGYKLATTLGHTVTPVFPSIVQLMLTGDIHKRLAGVKIKGTAELWAQGQLLATDYGDLLFTDYGISGPPVLQLSRPAGTCLQAGIKPEIKVVLVDDMNFSELFYLLQQRFARSGDKDIETSLIGFIHKRLIPEVLKQAGLYDKKKSAALLNAKEITALAQVLTEWRFEVKATRGWNSAQVTAGGVSTAEVEAKTLASKLVDGLYFAGELLDIDGKCGGFNLQWAWSSGWSAGHCAAEYLQKKERKNHAADK